MIIVIVGGIAMNVMNYLDYNSIADIRGLMPVTPVDSGRTQESVEVGVQDVKNPSNAGQEQSRERLLPTKDVIDYAVNSHMKTDKNLIGSESELENLDVTKAISDMQKDSILKEYQRFVQNPQKENINLDDGIVIKKKLGQEE